jgi:dsDNA-binding SOS-regulon protein
MAVIAVWQCDRDGSMFEDKKLAEEHDKYLLLAQRREQLAKACKGKPEELLEPFQADPQPKGMINPGAKASEKEAEEKDSNVTPLAANQ